MPPVVTQAEQASSANAKLTDENAAEPVKVLASVPNRCQTPPNQA
jgi:hypothetical protein